MATTPSRAVVPGYGMGLVTYVTGDFGGNTFRGVDMEKAIEAFAQVPLGQKLYVRPTWRELQKRPGRLDPDAYWKTTLAMAKQYGKRVGFRVQMSDPDIEEPALPDFVLDKVPMVPLRGGEWKRGPRPRTFLGAALRPSRLPGRLPRAERAAGRRARRQPARRVHGHVHVRLLGRGPHLALHRPSVSGWRDGGAHVRADARSPARALEEDPARHQHAAGLEPRRQLGAARPHHPQPQLAADRHDLHRERADRGDLQPAALGGGGARSGDVRRLAGIAASRRGRHLYRQRHRPRHGRGRQLLVALELARGEGRERHAATTAATPR